MQQLQRIDKIQQKDPQYLILQCNQLCTKNKLSKVCFGLWNDKEILKYFLFIHHHRKKFQSKSIRKSLKVFKQMAKFIKTRNSSQCRTHHQNLINKRKNIENALASFIREYPSFFDKYECIKETLNILDDMQFCSDTSTVVRQARQALITSEAENSSTQSVAKVNKQRANVKKLYVESQKIRIQGQEMRIKKLYQLQVLFNLWVGKVAHLTQLYQI